MGQHFLWTSVSSLQQSERKPGHPTVPMGSNQDGTQHHAWHAVDVRKHKTIMTELREQVGQAS